MDAKNRLAVTANIEAVLSFDGIPDKQWPKYLESKCGIPELNALRVLQSVAPIPPETRGRRARDGDSRTTTGEHPR